MSVSEHWAGESPHVCLTTDDGWTACPPDLCEGVALAGEYDSLHLQLVRAVTESEQLRADLARVRSQRDALIEHEHVVAAEIDRLRVGAVAIPEKPDLNGDNSAP